MAPRDLRGKVAIVGADEADRIGRRPEVSVLTLHAEAAKNALADAGLAIADVDGLFTAGISSNLLGEYLGVVSRYTDSTSVGGCSFIIHVEHAMLALGAGMIDPAVFEAVDYDPHVFSGFAFGMGVERIAMLKHGVDDIRLFYENDLRFLRQF